MGLSLLELVVPGVRSVATALKTVCAAASEMEELGETCQHVSERLALIYGKLLAMETKKTLPSDRVLKDYSALVGEFSAFLEKYRGKRWLYRAVSSATWTPRRTSASVRNREQQERVVEDRLTNDVTIAKEVVREVEQLEALTVLLYELQKDNQHKVVTRALDKVMRRPSVTVTSVPEWFLPEHKVEYKAQAFARGSFGSVHHGQMDFVDVVVKCLLVDTRGNKNHTDRFRKETALWFQFRHKHVLTMYGACDVSSPPSIVCEHATNGSLFDYLSDEKNQSFTFQSLREAASRLACLHGHRVVHADLKCDNILVAADRTAKIADFSFSYVRTLSASNNSVGAKSGAMRWRAPECLRGRSPTAASDVYSFGMCIIEAVSQEIPWGYHVDDDTVRDLVKSKELPDKPEAMVDHVWSLVEHMCSFEPAGRPSLELAVERLSEFAQDEAAHRGGHRVTSAQPAPRSLEDAIKSNNVDAVAAFLTFATDLERPNSVGATPLILAAMAGAAKVTEYLISRGANLDATTSPDVEFEDLNDKGCKALHAAAHFGHAPVAEILVCASPELAQVTTAGKKTATYFAARAGHAAVLEVLIEHGARDTSGRSTLSVACEFGKIECVRVLLRFEAAGFATQDSKNSFLHVAAIHDHADVIEELLRDGAMSEAAGTNGATPLILAAEKGKLETVRVLLWSKADMSGRNEYHDSALHAAAKGKLQAVQVLLRNKAGVNAKDGGNWTALQAAVTRGHTDIVRILLDAGATMANIALHAVAKGDHADVIEELLRHGATVDAVDYHLYTALMCAAEQGKVEAVRALLRGGADVKKTSFQWSALVAAATEGHADIVRILLDAGATVTETALRATSSNNNTEIVSMLKARQISQ